MTTKLPLTVVGNCPWLNRFSSELGLSPERPQHVEHSDPVVPCAEFPAEGRPVRTVREEQGNTETTADENLCFLSVNHSLPTVTACSSVNMTEITHPMLRVRFMFNFILQSQSSFPLTNSVIYVAAVVNFKRLKLFVIGILAFLHTAWNRKQLIPSFDSALSVSGGLEAGSQSDGLDPLFQEWKRPDGAQRASD